MDSKTNIESNSYPETLKAAAEILKNAQELHQASPQRRLELIYEMLMRAERNLHLENNLQDKANGFYPRSIGTASGNLQVLVPRDRDGDFRPRILPPPFIRDSQERLNLLQALFSSSYSPASLRHTLSELGMHYSPDELTTLKDEFLAEFESWSSRELPSDMVAIYIDAYHTQLKDKNRISKVAIYSVLGVDFHGQKDLLGVYVCPGSENKEFWLRILNNLIHRGLLRLLFVISDDFSGLTEAVATLFSKAHHQLCFIHMQRNIRRNMGREDAATFNHSLSQIKLETTFDNGMTRFDKLLENYQKKYPIYVKYLQQKASHYFHFLNLPQELRRYFYTTNSAESFNSLLEKMRLRLGGFFQSDNALKLNVWITYQKLRDHKWKNGINHVKANLYSLQQNFAQIYGQQPKP